MRRRFQSNRVINSAVRLNLVSMQILADIAESRYSERSHMTSNEDHSFCGCYKDRPRQTLCSCGEGDRIIEWVWDIDTKSSCTHVVNGNRDVRFHVHFSGGTAVIRGNQEITANQHYWEIKMTSLVYGTDMMVGIGTKDADIHKSSNKFCSILGIDKETWGLSYSGLFHHEGISRQYSSGFGQGTIIGVHLDMWNGTLSFYKNRQPLGIACTGLKGKTLYPMVSSTAARSGMRIIHSISFPTSLQFLCCVALRKYIASDQSVLDTLPLPPGMQTFLANNLSWLLGELSMSNLDSPSTSNAQKTSIKSIPGTSTFNTAGPSSQNSSGVSHEEMCSIPEWYKRNSCSHRYLTCNDCHTPIVAQSIHIEPHFPESPSSSSRDLTFASCGILLENYNRFQTLSRESTSSDTNEKTHGSDSKKLKYSYEYAVGLDEADSDDMSDDE